MCKPSGAPKDEGDYMGVPLATLLDTSMARGLSEEEARGRLARFGRNARWTASCGRDDFRDS